MKIFTASNQSLLMTCSLLLPVNHFFIEQKEFSYNQHLFESNHQVILLAQDFGDTDLCTDQPDLVDQILFKGKQLGVEIIQGLPKLPGKDATYEAFYNRLGIITVINRPMHPVVYCQLIVHEFIHVLQHLKSDLKGVRPLGWYVKPLALHKYGSLQEAEAYSYQNQIGKVLSELYKF